MTSPDQQQPQPAKAQRFRSDEMDMLMARVQELMEANVLAMIIRHPATGRISVTCPPPIRLEHTRMTGQPEVPDGQALRVERSSSHTYRELIGILAEHVSETGESEGAVDVLRRLLREHRCPRNQ